MSDALEAVFENVGAFLSQSMRCIVHFTRIDAVVLREWSNTWQPNPRNPPNGGWNWIDKHNGYKIRNRDYLVDFAIWGNGQLSGLVLAKRSRGRKSVSIYYIESNPTDHPLSGDIFEIVDLVLCEYAVMLSINKIRLIDPVDGLVGFYAERGYKQHKKTLFGSPYCEKEV